MPKLVDHDKRRRDLIQATLRIIVRQGLTGATMRDIAAEAGYANGAIKPYFSTKADLLASTYLHVFDSTNIRVSRMTQGLSGLKALETFGQEVLPVDQTLQEEARVVLSFWGEVAQSDTHVQTTRESTDQWRRWIITWLEQARSDGELAPSVDVEVEAEVLLTHMMGAQVMAIACGGRFDAEGFRVQLSYYLSRLAAVS